LSAPRADRRAAGGALSPPCSDREPLVRAHGIESALPAGARGIPEEMSCGGTNAPDPLAAEIRRRRLQLPTSGSLRRARVSAADDLLALAPGARFHGRRVSADRAASPHAVARRSGPARPGRGRDLRGAPKAGRAHPRVL